MTRLCILLLMTFFSISLKAQTQKEIDDYFEEIEISLAN